MRLTGAMIILLAAASLSLGACKSTERSSDVANMGVSTPVVEFPLEGEWWVVRSPGHAEFAFDLAAVDQHHRGDVVRSPPAMKTDG